MKSKTQISSASIEPTVKSHCSGEQCTEAPSLWCGPISHTSPALVTLIICVQCKHACHTADSTSIHLWANSQIWNPWALRQPVSNYSLHFICKVQRLTDFSIWTRALDTSVWWARPTIVKSTVCVVVSDWFPVKPQQSDTCDSHNYRSVKSPNRHSLMRSSEKL